jgi:hypothetical protein
MIQNPAYRFAADIPLPVKRKGLFFVKDKYKDQYGLTGIPL